MFTWIHTHDTTGVVHIVTPKRQPSRSDSRLKCGGHPLAAGCRLGYEDSLVTLVNGKRIDGDLRSARPENLESIVLELGKPPAAAARAQYNYSGQRM